MNVNETPVFVKWITFAWISKDLFFAAVVQVDSLPQKKGLPAKV